MMDARPIWLLPGMDGTGTLFGPLLDAMGEHAHACRSFAYRHGDATLDALADALPLPSEPIVLVAESFGGPIAIRLAARHPELVAHVVLIASFVRPPRPFLRIASIGARLLPTPPALAIELAMTGRDASPAVVASVRAAIQCTPRETIAARVASLAAIDVASELASLTMPITAIVATRDRLVPRAIADEPARLARQGRSVEIDGPHLLAQTRPHEVADVIAAILRA